MLKIDHFVVGAANLEEGRSFMESELGLPATGAGQHKAMGTHNALWRVGRAYLEVIAVDPGAAAPAHPRWFGLDDPATQARLRSGPKLLTWVVAAEDLSALPKPVDPGPAHRLTRDALAWQLTVPENGVPKFGGAYPSLITWEEGSKPPSETLPDQGLALAALNLEGPQTLVQALTTLGAAPFAKIREAETPRLSLTITSPATGDVEIR